MFGVAISGAFRLASRSYANFRFLCDKQTISAGSLSRTDFQQLRRTVDTDQSRERFVLLKHSQTGNVKAHHLQGMSNRLCAICVDAVAG